jgi:hypothetical protein
MLSCVGRGGDGQRIRDEILHIMHRWALVLPKAADTAAGSGFCCVLACLQFSCMSGWPAGQLLMGCAVRWLAFASCLCDSVWLMCTMCASGAAGLMS